MSRTELTRRDFHRLTAAAMGGLVAGSLIGCGGDDKGEEAPGGRTGTAGEGGDAKVSRGTSGAADAKYDVSLLLEEPHVCRGLNTCKGQATGGENECAGTGACATAEHHDCHGQNECKGQGGCGDYPGQNTCKGKGECSVPLMEGTWAKARAAFEKAMQGQGKEVGAAPDA
ncbi:MAG: hypothetical protein KY476_11105 [Planctomycetes bacterium]|nr:hypothetical protein [Planctomycetota bacterium]